MTGFECIGKRCAYIAKATEHVLRLRVTRFDAEKAKICLPLGTCRKATLERDFRIRALEFPIIVISAPPKYRCWPQGLWSAESSDFNDRSAIPGRT